MSTMNPGVRAVVAAVDRLTTQVKRLADAQPTPVAVADDAPTTTDNNGPRCVCGDPLTWYTAPSGGAGWVHDPAPGAIVLDAHKPRPVDGQAPTGDGPTPDDGPCGHRGPHPGFTCAEVDATQPYFHVRWEQEQQAPVADEDQLRTARRDSLLVLLSRAGRMRLSTDEAALLRQHVETEMRDADTARAVFADLAETYKAERRRGDALAEERNEAWAERDAEQARLRDLLRSENQRANKAIERETTAEQAAEEAQRERGQQAAVLAEVLRRYTPALINGQYAFYQAQEPVPVEEFQRWCSVVQHDVERPWWQQLNTVRAELEQAQAAIDRVRAVAALIETGAPWTASQHNTASRILAALDGTEQPEEQPDENARTVAEYQAAILRVLAIPEDPLNGHAPRDAEQEAYVRGWSFAIHEVRRAVEGTEQPTGCPCHSGDELCSGCHRCPNICNGCDG